MSCLVLLGPKPRQGLFFKTNFAVFQMIFVITVLTPSKVNFSFCNPSGTSIIRPTSSGFCLLQNLTNPLTTLLNFYFRISLVMSLFHFLSLSVSSFIFDELTAFFIEINGTTSFVKGTNG
jgi:hypothetical protein